MPLYNTMGSLRGMQFQASTPRAAMSSHVYRESEPGSEDNSDEESDGGYDSVHSVPSPSDELYDLQVARGELSEEYGDYLQDALAHGEEDGVLSDDSDGEAPSVASSRSRLATPPSHMASRLMDIGLFDLEMSVPPDFLGEDHTDDSHETDSDGELSNINSADDDDDEDLEEEYDEVPNPPQLPSVNEERLQEVWPLGDQSFSIFLCPITHDVMTDPVVSADGYTYERAAIARWFETSRKSPVTGQTLPHTDLVANHSVRTLLKMLIDMTEDCMKAPRAPAALASPHVTGSDSLTHASGSAPAAATAGLDSAQTEEVEMPTRTSSRTVPSVSAESPPPAPPMLSAERQREQAPPMLSQREQIPPISSSERQREQVPPMLSADRQREQSAPQASPSYESSGDASSRHRAPPPAPVFSSGGDSTLDSLAQTEVRELVHQMEAATMVAAAAAAATASTSSQTASSSPTTMSASTAAMARRQQRAQTSQGLLGSSGGGGGGSSSSTPPPHAMAASSQPPATRPSSQPQPSHTQSSAANTSQQQQQQQQAQRPQSSAGCSQRPQGPSTALPPLRSTTPLARTSTTPPRTPPEPSGAIGSRGAASSPILVPPLSYRNGPHIGRLPGQPPLPCPPVPPESASMSSSNSTGNRYSEIENAASLSRFDLADADRRHNKRSNSATGFNM